MKRFLSLLTVFVLAFTLAVPVGATEYNGYELPDVEAVWGQYSDEFKWASILYYEDTDQYYLWLTVTRFNYSSGSPTMTSDGYRYYAFNSQNNTWEYIGSSGGRYSKFSGFSYFWETTNEICDGSSCPATDVNIDGICDDCGMALMSLSRTPVAPDVTGSNKNYVMFYSGSVYKYTVYTSDESYTIRGEEYGARYRTYTDPSVTVQRYESYDGINWEQTYTGKTANDYPGEIGYELISSTFDWYTEEGDRFFPVPLWEEVQTVTQGEMNNLTTETAGTMKVLVDCGVGLMALLTAFVLFGRRSLLFLR